MSKRAFCQRCQKALAACICPFVSQIDNEYALHILQDPSEQKKAIGTARILELSLSKVKLTVGDVFDPAEFELDNTFLVFPDDESESIEQLHQEQRINSNTEFVLLDGSWKKAYKLLMTNTFLQALPKVMLTVKNKSAYRIRKSPRDDGLSTVEAGFYLLSALENDAKKFSPLLDTFNHMIDFQIKSMPKEIYEKNYVTAKPFVNGKKS